VPSPSAKARKSTAGRAPIQGHDPIVNGVDAGDLAILGAGALALTALAIVRFRDRDLRK
jgi:hypothetical protein